MPSLAVGFQFHAFVYVKLAVQELTDFKMLVMIQKKFLFLFFFNCSLSFSQSIEIGQDAIQIKQIIEWSTKNHGKTDTYGNKSNSYWTYDTKYYNGNLTEVFQCYKNQYLNDFGVMADYCKRYMMEDNKLTYVLTQFENIAIEKLQENYNSMYSKSKISNLYFFDNYKFYSKIYLSKDGLATIEMRKTLLSNLPKELQQTLNSKLAESESLNQKLDSVKSYQPKQRKILIRPLPDNKCNQQGKVVVQVSVNRVGNVISAISGVEGTTNNNSCLKAQAKIAALNTKMEYRQDAPEVEIRKISYNFTLN